LEKFNANHAFVEMRGALTKLVIEKTEAHLGLPDNSAYVLFGEQIVNDKTGDENITYMSMCIIADPVESRKEKNNTEEAAKALNEKALKLIPVLQKTPKPIIKYDVNSALLLQYFGGIGKWMVNFKVNPDQVRQFFAEIGALEEFNKIICQKEMTIKKGEETLCAVNDVFVKNQILPQGITIGNMRVTSEEIVLELSPAIKVFAEGHNRNNLPKQVSEEGSRKRDELENRVMKVFGLSLLETIGGGIKNSERDSYTRRYPEHVNIGTYVSKEGAGFFDEISIYGPENKKKFMDKVHAAQVETKPHRGQNPGQAQGIQHDKCGCGE